MKSEDLEKLTVQETVAPARERGLKFQKAREDAYAAEVAPARERGLKFYSQYLIALTLGRSREGAWIEIGLIGRSDSRYLSRSREGAWIEIILLAEKDIAFLSLPRGSVD